MLFLFGGECFDAHAQASETLVDFLCFLELLTSCLSFGELFTARQVDHIELGNLDDSVGQLLLEDEEEDRM